MSISEEKEGKIGRIQPFDSSGVFRGADGVLHYEGLHRSLVEMLRETAERVPDREAVVEVGGSALTYREYWDAAARVAGGLAAAGIERGDRVAIRLPPSRKVRLRTVPAWPRSVARSLPWTGPATSDGGRWPGVMSKAETPARTVPLTIPNLPRDGATPGASRAPAAAVVVRRAGRKRPAG